MSELLSEQLPDLDEVTLGDTDLNAEMRQLFNEEDNRLVGLFKDSDGQDESSLMEAIMRHHSEIYAISYRSSQNHEDAEDITQEVLFKAWRKIDQYRVGTNFGAWLTTITQHTCINLASQKSRQVKQDGLGAFESQQDRLKAFASNYPTPEEQVLEENHAPLETALGKLQGGFATALKYVYIEGLSNEEHSSRAGIPLGTSLSRTIRGRKRLLKQAGIDFKPKNDYSPDEVSRMTNYLTYGDNPSKE